MFALDRKVHPGAALPERRPHQRRERLHVRAHDQHVARLERRIRGERREQQIPQHLHLPRRAVTRVYLDTAVRLRARFGGSVGTHGSLYRTEQGVRGRLTGKVSVAVQQRIQALLQLPDIAGQSRQQGVGDQIGGAVVGAWTNSTSDRPLVVRLDAGDRASITERGPHGRARVRHPEVDVAVGGEGGDDSQLVGGESGQAEKGESLGQVDRVRFGAKSGAGVSESFGRARGIDRCAQRTPQLRLPREIVGHRPARTVGVRALGPVEQHPRALGGVGVEQRGEVGGGGVAPADSVIGPRKAEMTSQHRGPRLVGDLVDHPQQGPHQSLTGPRIVGGCDPARGGQHLGHQRGRRGKGDIRGYPVTDLATPAIHHTEHTRQPLRQPALHPFGRHRDHIREEWIGGHRPQQTPQSVGQRVGAFGAMEVQRHPLFIRPATDPQSRDPATTTGPG